MERSQKREYRAGECEVSRGSLVGYQLVSWHQRHGVELDPGAVFESLIEGRRVEGLIDLPVDAMLDNLLAAFPRAVREPNGPAHEWFDS
jgi:hypothetical protein